MEKDNHDYHDQDQDQNHENERRSSGAGGSRWNPTKEQIGLLERMYSEGIRTPSAEQIQQITARLQAFGPIEGKNVFYWFQNHKARQRQKQRQERLAVANAHHNFLAPPPFHHLHHHNHNHHHHRLPNPVINLNFNPKPIIPSSSPYHHQYLPTSPNGICNPYYQFPPTNQGFYTPRPPQHNYSTAPAADDHLGSGNRRSKVGSIAMMMISTTKSFDHHDGQEDGGHCRCMETRTLNLFPVHPTGILEHKLGSSMNNSSATNNTCDDDTCKNDNGSYQPGPGPEMFDFFSSSETDHD